MSYRFTVQDKLEKIASEIWEASKQNDHNIFGECILKLRALRLTAETRVEYAKAALEGLCSNEHVKPGADTYGPYIAELAFEVADAMLAEEAKSR